MNALKRDKSSSLRKTHRKPLTANCRVRAVRRQLGSDVTARLVTALVLSRLDYCSAVLAFHTGTVPASPARSGTHRSGSQAAWLQLFESCTGCQSLRGSRTSCACWFTSRVWDIRRNISQTFWHRLPIFHVDLHCVLHRVATRRAADTSTNWRQSLFCYCTASMEQATDEAETAAIDELVSSWSKNMFVSFCLRAPRYGLTLWCALGLLVGCAIQVPQLQL